MGNNADNVTSSRHTSGGLAGVQDTMAILGEVMRGGTIGGGVLMKIKPWEWGSWGGKEV